MASEVVLVAVDQNGIPSSEISEANAYCVVYKLENADWVVTGEGWSQVHLYRDKSDDTYRVVGWTVSEFKVVINCNVTHLCKYKKKSPDFHKFQDENAVVYGFGFYKKEESLKEADKFMAKVTAVIQKSKADMAAQKAQSVPAPGGFGGTSPPATSAFTVANGPSALGSVMTPAAPSPLTASGGSAPVQRGGGKDRESAGTGSGGASPSPPLPLSSRQPSAGTGSGGAVSALSQGLKERFQQQAGATGQGGASSGAAAVSPRTQLANPRGSAMYSAKPIQPQPPAPALASSPAADVRRGTVMDRINDLAQAAGHHVEVARDGPASPTGRGPLASANSNSNRPLPPPPHGRTPSTTPAVSVPADDHPAPARSPSPPTNAQGHALPPTALAFQKPHGLTTPTEKKRSSSFNKDVGPNPAQHTQDSKQMDDYYIKGVPPLGKLSVLPPKPVKHEAANSSAITDPYGVIHTHHVKYDHLTRSYKGLPPEWEAQLKRQFGLPPNRVETMKLDKYTSRIPCVLVQMKEYLFKHGGLESEGIFRLAPDADESTFVKQQLNENSFEKCRDINCISNLIKVWFRELPDHLLNPVNKDSISGAEDEDAAGRIIPTIPEPNQSIYLWLLDLCVEVAAHSNVNKMTAQNLAVVIAPNLFSPDNSDPMKTLMYSQKVSQFLYRSILWREKTTK